MDNHGQDGVAHVTFYDKATLLSFVWDGKHGSEVAVSYGGYAEPVVDTFSFGDPAGPARTLSLDFFEGTCRAFTLDWRRRLLDAVQRGFADGSVVSHEHELPDPNDFANNVHYEAYTDALHQGHIYASGGMVDTRELASYAGFERVDTALPQQWVDDVEKMTGQYPTRDGRIFVWAYDLKGIWGEPLPLTVGARELLAKYEEAIANR